MKKLPIIGVLLLVIAQAAAQSGGTFEITRSTIASGGGSMSGGDFSLTGTIGQVDAGMTSGGDFVLNGGFWTPAPQQPLPDLIFAAGFEQAE